MNNLLIVDDEQGIRQLLTLVFSRAGYTVRAAENGKRAITLLEEAPADVIISDVRMPDMNGIEFLRAARERLPEVGVVMMSAFATLETGARGIQTRRRRFRAKAVRCRRVKGDRQTRVRPLAVAARKSRLKEEVQLFKRTQDERGRLDNIIGRSPRMQAVYQMIETVAEVNSTVLITGESGTGKELVARAIHNRSQRHDKPFISINCGAFTETLLESNSSATCAAHSRARPATAKGFLKPATRGTIFLDEIGEMPTAMQVKFLRVLQERKVRPVGGHDEREIDVRVIAATNRDLRQMVKDNTFREDLFYRISVIPVELPPLRDRVEDIPVLVNHFIEKFCEQTGRRVGVSKRALELLEHYPWQGNVRELEHTIERAVALERTDQIQP
jgi:DNA-binding NtrC family response regulator